MASTSDLKSYATSTHDFYALLSLPATFSQSDLDRAWRRTALKYHPDKVGAADIAAAEKFHLAQIGYDVLSDPSIRSLYDNARTAREQKERARKMFEGERKKMREDLEAREEEEFEVRVRRLAEDGKRRRLEREEKLRKEMEKEQAEEDEARKRAGDAGVYFEGTSTPLRQSQPQSTNLTSSVTEIDRSIKVRWIDSTPSSISKETLTDLFTRFGPIESSFILKTKPQRIGPSRQKTPITTGVLVYTSVVGAHAAINDTKKQIGPPWDTIQEVTWAAGKEPGFIAEINARNGIASRDSSPAPVTPIRNSLRDNVTPGIPGPGTENGSAELGAAGVRKVPSFASFSSAAFGTPRGSPVGKVGSPSLEEITKIRLREAEKKRLEAEIRKKEEQEELNG